MQGCTSTTALIILLYSIFIFSLSLNSMAAAVDILRANKNITDGSTIVSSGGHFELVFISPGSSINRYAGIWYKKISKETIVWIANRETPLNTTSGLFKLNSNGDLVVLDGYSNVVWSSNSSISVNSPLAQLLDSGNLVIRNENDSDPGNYLWQSFDIPGNTFLPNSKVGWNLETGHESFISSWKSEADPSPGEYSFHIDRNGFPQSMTKKGSSIQSRAGPWNGVRFSGNTNLKPNPIYTFGFVSDDKELYYYYEAVSISVVTNVILHPLGSLQRRTWIEKSQKWQLYLTGQIDDCDRYGLCGAYGSCNIDSSPCRNIALVININVALVISIGITALVNCSFVCIFSCSGP